MRSAPVVMLIVATIGCPNGVLGVTAPSVVSPGNAQRVVTLTDRCPTFTWAPAVGAESMRIAIWTAPAREGAEPRLIRDVRLGGDVTSWTPAAGQCLAIGASYLWKAASVSEQGEVVWSAPLWFAVVPPAPPVGAGQTPAGPPARPGTAAGIPITQFSVGGTGNVSAAAVTANSFAGDGSALTGLNPASIAAGTAGINVSGTASNVTGVVQVGKGGTGATTAAQALINLGAAAADHTHSGTPYDHVIIVAKSGGTFTSIQAALTSITDNDATNRYLVWVAPGTYSEQVTMKPFVDIEGAGELATKVTNTGGANENLGCTVRGANDAELRFITVENTGGAAYAVGVFNSAKAVRLTHVTATASGGTDTNAGVCNFAVSSSVLTFVTATATGGQYTYGVENSASSPTMTNVTATGKDGTVINHGVMNMVASAPVMEVVNAEASGGGLSYGVKNESGSDPRMSEVVAAASGASTSNYGMYNLSSSPTIRNSVATALSGTGSKVGMYNWATTGSGDNIVTIDNCRIAGLLYGVQSEVASGATGTTLTVRVIHSWVSGPTNSIYGDDRALTYVGTSQLLGGAVHDGGAGAPLVRCYACYDENFTNPGANAEAKLSTCP